MDYVSTIGWISPDAVFYPIEAARVTHINWAWANRKLVEQTGVVFPSAEDYDDDTVEGDVYDDDLFYRMLERGWVRQVDPTKYCTTRAHLHFLRDYILMEYPNVLVAYVDVVSGRTYNGTQFSHEMLNVHMDESFGFQSGWITPDDTYYPCGDYTHMQWAIKFRETVEETGVVFPAEPERDLSGRLEQAMVNHGWIRKASPDSYYLHPKNKQRALDYALMYTKVREVFLDYSNGDDERVVLDRPESARSIVKRLLALLG